MVNSLSRKRRIKFFNKLRHIKRKHYTNNVRKKRVFNIFMFFLFMFIPVYIFYKSIPIEYATIIDGLLLRIFIAIKSHSILLWIKSIIYLSWTSISTNILYFFTSLTIKKFTILSIMGLGKRFIIDHVVVKFIYKYFIKDIKTPIKELFLYVYNDFRSFSLKKKIIGALSLFLPATLVSYSLYSMNLFGLIFEKVFSANIWKIILAFFIKSLNAVFYFFSNYIWNSWLAPIIEIIIFSYLIGFLEKHVAFIGIPLRLLYKKFENIGNTIIGFFNKHFFIPSKKNMRKSTLHINKKINLFINKNKSIISLREKQKNRSRALYFRIKKEHPVLFKKIIKRRKK